MTKILLALTLAALASEASAQQRTLYDASGNVVRRSAIDGQGTTTIYDSRGRVTNRGSTTSGNTTTTYDAAGRNIGRATTSR